MTTIRIAAANIEWMNRWFTSDAGPAAWKATASDDGTAFNPREAARRAAAMIRAFDPDVLAVEEAPSRPEELRLFISDFLSADGVPIYDFLEGDSGGEQKLAILFRRGLALTRTEGLAPLLSNWECDVDGDMRLQPYHFTRNPLVADLRIAGERLRLVVLHTKSSYVNQGEELWQTDPQKYVEAALMNRRRISSEAMHLRRWLDEQVGADLGTKIVVMGDFNDGPAMDYFEERYLTHNVIDILLGSGFENELMFTHAQHDVPRADRYSVVFRDFVENDADKHLLLDHVLLSPGLSVKSGLRKADGSGKIHHTEWQANVDQGGKRRDQRPSDHRPVSVELAY